MKSTIFVIIYSICKCMSSTISYTQSTLIGFYRSINAMKFKRLQKNYLQENI